MADRRSVDGQLSICKICNEGVFATQRRVFARRVEPSMRSGLVHFECACRVNAETVGEPTGPQPMKRAAHTWR